MAGDVEAHRGSDGRAYVIDLARLFPGQLHSRDSFNNHPDDCSVVALSLSLFVSRFDSIDSIDRRLAEAPAANSKDPRAVFHRKKTDNFPIDKNLCVCVCMCV